MYDETEPMHVTVADVCDNYIYNYIYMSAQTYRQIMGNDAPVRTVLVQTCLLYTSSCV